MKINKSNLIQGLFAGGVLALSATSFAASTESGLFQVTGVRAQATGTNVAVYVDGSLNSSNYANCALTDFLLIDAGTTGGKNALASILMAKSNADDVSFFIDTSSCALGRYIQVNSVFVH